MDEKAKLAVLKRVAHALNARSVHWALGASCFLYLKGIAPTFHDLDLMLVSSEASEVDALLQSLGQRMSERYDKRHYGTRFFGEYVVDGVDLDVMADFSIKVGQQEYFFPLKEDSVVEFYDLEGEKIPFESLTIWRERYALMGRQDKTKMIDDYLRSSPH